MSAHCGRRLSFVRQGRGKDWVWMIEYDRLERRGRENFLDRAALAGRGYVRRGLLGTGTFSDVYCVEKGGRKYACKVSAQAQMLEREARVLEGLGHPLYPEFGEFWKEAGIGILIREYVEGHSLEEMLKRRRFSADQTVRAGISLAEGLQYLHGLAEGLLFRDLKPANVIVTESGRVRLIDLGCACSMEKEVTSLAGSPGFAAPEQLRAGGCLTPSCDVYGLGKTLEAMLGKRNPSCPAGERRGMAGRSRSCGRTGLRKAKKRLRLPCGQRLERELLRFLAACTQEDVRKRMSDMGEVRESLCRLRALS